MKWDGEKGISWHMTRGGGETRNQLAHDEGGGGEDERRGISWRMTGGGERDEESAGT